MRQIEDGGQGVQVDSVERSIAFRVARRVAGVLHRPRAWLNQQVQLVRLGARAGDTQAFLRAYEQRFPLRTLDPSRPSMGDLPGQAS
jgi:hypothetical protein